MPNPPRSSPSRVRVVELLTFPLAQLLDVTGPAQVFASANDFVLESGGRPTYELKVVAQGGAQVTALAGLKPSTQLLPQEGSLVDTLMVAGGRGVEAAAADRVIVDWVQMRAKRARRIASVCTEAFLLAASGLLDGRRAATHWSHCAELARRYSKVRVEADPGADKPRLSGTQSIPRAIRAMASMPVAPACLN
jgi:transcriptional regulator GlxA family with amidase domain